MRRWPGLQSFGPPKTVTPPTPGASDPLGADQQGIEDGASYVAILSVERFATLRPTIGAPLAGRLLDIIAARVLDALPACEIGRVQRTAIEFAFRASSPEAADKALHDLMPIAEQRIELDEFRFDLQMKLGVARCPAGSNVEDSFDAAAAALAEAQASRVPIAWAGALSTSASLNDLRLMRDLPSAIANDELQLHYQPKLHARSNTIDSVEGLLRWPHTEHGAVPVDRLIALAEKTGAIRDVTEWVIARAVRDCNALAFAGHPVVIHVNISATLLSDREFAERAMALAAVAPGGIGFEITETAVIEDPERAFANLHAFAAAGIRIAIDDYGSGLSSLAYLKQLPANELKIDRLFIASLVDSNRDPVLVRSTIDLAHALEMEVTAEGVDNPLALSLLRVMGCDRIQGFIVSPALPLAELRAFLANDDREARLSTATIHSLHQARRRSA